MISLQSLPDHPLPRSVPFGADHSALESLARQLRYQIIQMSHGAKTPHLGSSLSCVDILVAAYWRALRIDPARADDPQRDRFILSKGHAAPALYVALAARGFFSDELLETYSTPAGVLAEHPIRGSAPGIEAATGSLGHGLPIGCGLALAARLRRDPTRVMVVLSDGECNEGSVWEAALFAAAQQLSHLTIVVDYNKWQATGRSNEVLALAPLAEKWRAFGWDAEEVDGHSIAALSEAMNRAPHAMAPRAIIAHTVKGKGIPMMEDDNNWHYRIPTAAEVAHCAEVLNAL